MDIIQTLAAAHNWNLPIVCPVCNSKLTLNENHCKLSCTNDFCRSRYAGRISKWTSMMEIKEFGLKTIDVLIEAGIIDTISSLYTMDLTAIASLDGFGKRSAEKMKKQLDSHLEMTLSEFIAGYNIEGCGEKLIAKIIETYNISTLDEMLKMTNYECEGVGKIISDKLLNGLSNLKDDMKKTLEFVTIKKPEIKKTAVGVLGGKSFCFTGAASRPRKELWSLVENNGGVVFESVKKGLDYLVLADVNSTSSKAVKARKEGITLISEEDFVNMCNV